MNSQNPCLPRAPTAKILPWPLLLERRRRHRVTGEIVVWSNGCFDLLHAGHVSNLQAARELGDVLMVGINSDRSVKVLKGANRPLVNEHDRSQMVASLECVDYVIVLDTLIWDRQLAELQPDIYCKGAEYGSVDAAYSPERAAVEAYGGQVRYMPMVAGFSTTSLIARIREYDPEP
jgi:rfaE bifunctional protein nucleotidyltransferase chain/domain